MEAAAEVVDMVEVDTVEAVAADEEEVSSHHIF